MKYIDSLTEQQVTGSNVVAPRKLVIIDRIEKSRFEYV